MSAIKEAFQKRMIKAIENDDMYLLRDWTDQEVKDLEFAAELWSYPRAQAVLVEELGRRGY